VGVPMVAVVVVGGFGGPEGQAGVAVSPVIVVAVGPEVRACASWSRPS
jgi:hypothetical protein